ncbi:hypothetical protein BGW80DRAFT_1164876 [Lactifluus volemus]|nr:hypothetical protein BGW80DRAFT_1164876 [Lactifluus volemus]
MQTGDSSPSQSPHSRSPVKSASPAGGDNGSSSAPRIETARPPPPWFTESYFSNEPATAAARKVYHSILGLNIGILVLVIFSVLSIYWGALWQTPAHVHNLNGWVVDFDGGEIGQFVSRAVVASNGPPTAISWNTVSTDLFPNGMHDVEDAVVQNKAWAIITINPNATAKLNAAVIATDSTYVSNGTITAYVAEARSENAYRAVIGLYVTNLLNRITQAFNAQYVESLPDLSSNLTALVVTAPGLVALPISYTLLNVRPFDVPVATAVDFVGLIYLLILAFVVVSAHYMARVDATHLEDRLTFKWLVIIRIVNPVIIYFFLSCCFSLLSLAFQVPFSRFFGSSGFVIYWMLSWVAMCALGGIIDSMITILTPRFVPFFLLFWIILNVSVCIFPPALLPGFYHYAYAIPFYNVQQAVRAIIFGTRNQIGLNFGILIAWIVVSWCMLILFQYIKRRQSIRAHEKAVGAKPMLEKSSP